METQQQEFQSNNVLVYTLLFILVVMIGYITYIYISYDMLKKGELKEKYVLKTDVTFSMLPSYEKSRYIEYFEHNNKITELNRQLQYAQNDKGSNSSSIIEKIVEVEKIVKVPVERIVKVEKIVKVPVEKIKKSNFSFNTYTCKSMKSGSIKVSKKCTQELYKFLDNNKHSKMFEVIGMVDNQDFKLINKLKDVYGEKKIKGLSKYSQIGLSRQRVIEASWLIKEYVGNYKNIKTVNYTVNAKNKKGFVVRAYK